MKPKLAFALTLIVLLIVFFFQNTHTAKINFLFWDREMTLAVVITISTLIGFGLGLILPRILHHNKENRYKLEKNMPKTDEPIAE